MQLLMLELFPFPELQSRQSYKQYMFIHALRMQIDVWAATRDIKELQLLQLQDFHTEM